MRYKHIYFLLAYSTIICQRQLANWQQDFLSLHTLNTILKSLQGILKPETVQEMWQKVDENEGIADKDGWYGWGWSVLPEKQTHGSCQHQKHTISHVGKCSIVPKKCPTMRLSKLTNTLHQPMGFKGLFPERNQKYDQFSLCGISWGSGEERILRWGGGIWDDDHSSCASTLIFISCISSFTLLD